MDFTTTEDQQALVGLATQILRRARRPRSGSTRSTPQAPGSTPTCGSSSRTPASSAPRCRRTSAAAASASPSWPCCSSRSAAHVAQVPLLRDRAVRGPADRPLRHRRAAQPRSARRRRRHGARSRPRSSRPAATTSPTRHHAPSRRDGCRSPAPRPASRSPTRPRRRARAAHRPTAASCCCSSSPGPEASPLRAATGTNGLPLFEVELNDAPAELRRPTGADALGWVLDRALTGLAATALGVSGRALQLSATYTTGREQFGRPIATFQAVGHRLADAYIDVEAHAAHHPAGRLAARQRAARPRRGAHRQVVGGRGRPPGRARRPARARRRRHRPRVPAAPLLPLVQAARVHPRHAPSRSCSRLGATLAAEPV